MLGMRGGLMRDGEMCEEDRNGRHTSSKLTRENFSNQWKGFSWCLPEDSSRLLKMFMHFTLFRPPRFHQLSITNHKTLEGRVKTLIKKISGIFKVADVISRLLWRGWGNSEWNDLVKVSCDFHSHSLLCHACQTWADNIIKRRGSSFFMQSEWNYRNHWRRCGGVRYNIFSRQRGVLKWKQKQIQVETTHLVVGMSKTQAKHWQNSQIRAHTQGLRISFERDEKLSCGAFFRRIISFLMDALSIRAVFNLLHVDSTRLCWIFFCVLAARSHKNHIQNCGVNSISVSLFSPFFFCVSTSFDYHKWSLRHSQINWEKERKLQLLTERGDETTSPTSSYMISH